MTNGRERQIEKIQKLLNLADSAEGAEGLLAFERATELLAKYQLDEAMVRGIDLNDLDLGKEDYDIPSSSSWVKNLMCHVSRAFGCMTVFVPVRTGKCNSYKRVALFGTKADRTTTKMMFEYAVGKVDRLTIEERKRLGKVVSKESRLYSFQLGIVRGMGTTLEGMMEKAKPTAEAGKVYALTLRSKEQKVASLLQQTFPITKIELSKADVYANAFNSGIAAGQAVGFNRQAEGRAVGLLK